MGFVDEVTFEKDLETQISCYPVELISTINLERLRIVKYDKNDCSCQKSDSEPNKSRLLYSWSLNYNDNLEL